MRSLKKILAHYVHGYGYGASRSSHSYDYLNWRRALRDGGKSARERRREAQARHQREVQWFYANQALPALQEVQRALEREGRRAEIINDDCAMTLIVKSPHARSVDEFRYSLRVAKNYRVWADLLYTVPLGPLFLIHHAKAYVRSQLHTISRHDIARSFVHEYNKVRHR